jgi:hypothetical protein
MKSQQGGNPKAKKYGKRAAGTAHQKIFIDEEEKLL